MISDEYKREVLALIWALKRSDLSTLQAILQHPEEDTAQMTTEGSGNAIFYRRLVAMGLATGSPYAGPETPVKSMQFALTPQGKALLRAGFNLALSSGWPPRESIVAPEAVRLLQYYAAEDINAAKGESIAKLASIYAAGKGVAKNAEEALRLYKEAAALGDATALNNLGVACFTGEGAPKDPARALDCFRKAIEAGSIGALENLGNMYSVGEGVPKDAAEAVTWWRKAAELGRAPAMGFLAISYLKGLGIPRDDLQAYIWSSLAIKGRFDATKTRAAAAASLKPDQIREADEIVSQWKVGSRRPVK